MSPADNDSFIAMPPPGVPAEKPAAPADVAPEVSEADFIVLPPGIALDSGTFKLPARTPPAPREAAPDIVFVPTVIGQAPVLPVAEPSPAPAAPAPAAPAPAEPAPAAPVPTPAPVAVPAATPEPVALPTAPVAVALPVAGWRLELADGGETVSLEGRVLVGRNPAASADWPGATLLAISDQTRSISKTHALLEVEGDDLWVHDLDSTNGVYVVVGDDVVEVTPAERVRIPTGASLELGEYVMLVVRS